MACKHLRSVEIPSTVEYIGKYCFNDSGIESITLPPTLKRIEAWTFDSCKNLRSVEIPSGVEYIGMDCFHLSETKEITLPATLKEIDKDAFEWSRLKTIWVEEGCTVDVKKYVDSDVEVRRK